MLKIPMWKIALIFVETLQVSFPTWISPKKNRWLQSLIDYKGKSSRKFSTIYRLFTTSSSETFFPHFSKIALKRKKKLVNFFSFHKLKNLEKPHEIRMWNKNHKWKTFVKWNRQINYLSNFLYCWIFFAIFAQMVFVTSMIYSDELRENFFL